jgi:hypothetical protein
MRQGERHGYDLNGDKERGIMVMILKETRGETR